MLAIAERMPGLGLLLLYSIHTGLAVHVMLFLFIHARLTNYSVSYHNDHLCKAEAEVFECHVQE